MHTHSHTHSNPEAIHLPARFFLVLQTDSNPSSREPKTVELWCTITMLHYSALLTNQVLPYCIQYLKFQQYMTLAHSFFSFVSYGLVHTILTTFSHIDITCQCVGRHLWECHTIFPLYILQICRCTTTNSRSGTQRRDGSNATEQAFRKKTACSLNTKARATARVSGIDSRLLWQQSWQLSTIRLASVLPLLVQLGEHKAHKNTCLIPLICVYVNMQALKRWLFSHWNTWHEGSL